MPITNLRRRSSQPEWMDESSIQDSRLTDALSDLRQINRTLGGFSTSLAALEPYLLARCDQVVRVLDIGCGGGDFAETLTRWAALNLPDLQLYITGIDNSPATVAWAESEVSKRLPTALASRINFYCCDAFAMPFSTQEFDIAHTSLFMHHFRSDDVIRLLREMNRTSKSGIVVNDLHRHAVAYSSIKFLTTSLNFSQMVQHDAPLSVHRGFTRDELRRIATVADIGAFTVTWHWAFRWLLSTVTLQNV